MALAKSNHTEVPNDLMEKYLILPGASIKVFLVICRQTRGWHKDCDPISLSQIKNKTDLSEEGIIQAVLCLERNDLITVTRRKGKTNVYEINYSTELRGTQSTTQLSGEDHSTELSATTQLSRDTKERKETNKRNVLSPEYPPEFETWWELYPRKTQKQAAYTKYKATKNKGATLEMLKMSAICYRNRCDKDETDQKYMLHPKTFLGPDCHWLEWYNNAEQIRKAEIKLRVPTPKKEQPELTPGQQKKNQEAVRGMMEKLNVKFGARRVR